MKKAVSPLIAVMILIGVALGIGVGLSGWIMHYVSRQTEYNPCSLKTDYVIDSAYFNTDNSILTVRVTNRGSTPLYGFGVVLANGTDTVFFNSSSPELTTSPDISEKNRLEKGQSLYVNIDLSDNNGMGVSLDNITITNEVCPDVSATADSIVFGAMP